MSISQAALGRLFGYAFLLGAILAFCYDLLRLTRIFFGVHYCRRGAKRLHEIRLPFIKPYGRRTERRALGIVVFFEDLFFCIASAIAVILLLFQYNNGKFRFPVLIVIGVGFLIYRATLGRAFLLLSEVIAFCIEVCFKYTVYFITLPFRLTVGFLKDWITRIAGRVQGIHKRSMRRRCTEQEIARLQRDACGLLPQDLPKQRRPKRGKIIAKRKKTIQLNPADAHSTGASHRRVDRSIRQ
jgi:hypothetical protein